MTYDVRLEAYDDTPDDVVSEGQTDTVCDPGTLLYDTTYYWRVIARDNHGAYTLGPTWSFTTELNKAPYKPIIQGKAKGNPGKEYTYTFTLSDPEENPQYVYVDWGDGTSEYYIDEYSSPRHYYEQKNGFDIYEIKIQGCYDWIEYDFDSLNKLKLIEIGIEPDDYIRVAEQRDEQDRVPDPAGDSGLGDQVGPGRVGPALRDSRRDDRDE